MKIHPTVHSSFIVKCHTPSPIGLLQIFASAGAVVRINFSQPDQSLPELGSGDETDPESHPLLAAAVEQLALYFAGHLQHFSLPLALAGTQFQRLAWDALLDIPYGQTTTYAQQAVKIGNPAARRAVGAANGRNPIPILVPCHRVIGSRGDLTGYGGGVDRKAWLLAHEQIWRDDTI